MNVNVSGEFVVNNSNFFNYILPFDINIFSFLFRPLKAFVFWSGYYFLQKWLVYDTEGNLAGIKWYKISQSAREVYEYLFYKSENLDSNLIILIKKDIELYKFIQRILKYLFDEFNLFYVFNY